MTGPACWTEMSLSILQICCLHFCSSVFWLQHDSTTTKYVVALVGSVKRECTLSLGT